IRKKWASSRGRKPMSAKLSGKGKVAGVMGFPITHSLSPALHSYWLNQLGIDGAYVPLTVNPETIESALRALPLLGFAGASLTLPHKELALNHCDSVDDTARAIGAVNTILVKEGKLHGTNTDAYGFIANIRAHIKGKKKAVLLGAGGAARAVAYALKAEGFESLLIANRSQAKAESIAAAIPGCTPVHWQQREAVLEGADLLVNATSLGMAGKEPLDITLASLPKTSLVTDIVYTPLITPLLAQASARGNPVVDGLGMLLYQAVPAFEAFFGTRPEVTPQLRQYLLGQEAK
ncbi:MAG: shikimate dehydrogenase, partial [Rickettsiales bacterium]|nr:shikimate dehydrogenase [Rickettsiales bacterium]